MTRTWRIAGLLLAALSAGAAEERGPSEETPYVISPTIVVDTMLDMAKVTNKDFLIDLGSGDGRIVIEAAKRFKAHGYGVDYDPRLVKLATDNAKRAGVADLIRFYERDIFKTDFSEATVVTMYLLPEYNAILKPKLLALKPGTRIVSHDYGIDDWPPDAERTIPVPDKPVGARKESVIYAWTVPAKVAGRWRSEIPGIGDLRLEFKQHYQTLSGIVQMDGHEQKLDRIMLSGDTISFSFDHEGQPLNFVARVSVNAMTGEMRHPGNSPRPWQASKL